MRRVQNMNMAPRLLHGTLIAAIGRIEGLREDFCSCVNPFSQDSGPGPEKLGKRFLSKLKRMVLCQPEIVGTMMYATVDLDKARVARTRMIGNASRPQWDESFCIYCAHEISEVIFTVKDDNPVGATLIGRGKVPVDEIINGYIFERWVDILDEEGKPIPGGPKIKVKLQFFSVTQEINWAQGIKSPQYEGVPRVFFKQRDGCQVTLYQDAHVPDNFRPIIPLGSGSQHYEPHRCWEDIFDAITNAKYLIYITGWSVNTEITLVRDPHRKKRGGNTKLGDLLKERADAGVRVLMLVWYDKSASFDILKRDGLMATHGPETEQFFKDTNVHCYLCPRNPDGGSSIIQGFEAANMFTHHQKSVIVDAAVPNDVTQKRRIVSFIGGIDLCDGRYDTQDHPLFKTLNTEVHSHDFHQPNFHDASIEKGGPREPWHDIHCKLEGPVAWDVLFNFEQRWKKSVPGGIRLLFEQRELESLTTIPLPVLQPNDPEAWNVQLFRSIDGGDAYGFPVDPREAAGMGLVGGKNNTIDRSIQDAYIQAIRRAKRFIYIENQYFLGSSFAWKPQGIKPPDIGALHLIPRELSLKIVKKIQAGERFTVYVVIPMWPEGIPESATVQAILDWQRRTMEVMYSDITEALRKKELEADPREYLTFFCLGNRETRKFGEYVPQQAPEPDSDYARAQLSRRFMIYVHAKMMIVDDEYIIIGSANINQRSMDGGRDSEIAMGAFQPQHLAIQDQPARGQIYGFRMALWYEHLQVLPRDFEDPGSLQCVQNVNQIAEENWKMYASETLAEDMIGHLLRYPIHVLVEDDGRFKGITYLQGVEHFPDTKARVLGTKSDVIPPVLTT